MQLLSALSAKLQRWFREKAQLACSEEKNERTRDSLLLRVQVEREELDKLPLGPEWRLTGFNIRDLGNSLVQRAAGTLRF